MTEGNSNSSLPATLSFNLPFISEPNSIPNEEYHRGEVYKNFISSTSLKNHLVSPLFFKYMFDEGGKKISEEARETGSAYHDYLASIANTGGQSWFDEQYFIFEPPVNEKTGKPYGRDTKAFEDAYAQAIMANSGKTPLSETTLLAIKAMVKQLLYGSRHNSKDILSLLKNGDAERSYFCEYMGAHFKYRPDLETSWKIIDWKTIDSDDLHEDTIARQIEKYKYHISAPFYQFFCHEITGRWKEFYWVFQQKSPPFDFVIVDAAPWSFEFDIEQMNGQPTRIVTGTNIGARIFLKLLDQHIKCTEDNIWDGASIFIEPGYRGKRIMNNTIPSWKKEITFYND